MTSQFEEPDAS